MVTIERQTEASMPMTCVALLSSTYFHLVCSQINFQGLLPCPPLLHLVLLHFNELN